MMHFTGQIGGFKDQWHVLERLLVFIDNYVLEK
jgi:hypothetical protein